MHVNAVVSSVHVFLVVHCFHNPHRLGGPTMGGPTLHALLPGGPRSHGPPPTITVGGFDIDALNAGVRSLGLQTTQIKLEEALQQPWRLRAWLADC